MAGSNLLIHLDTIDQNDLIYVERDMNFAQKVGLCFLLYGDDHSDATYILQKLLAMTRSDFPQSDLLIKFAKSRPETWRRHLVEALCIIGARKVLRRLGFCWQELRMHYLPHIAGITLHVHPLLKSLYRMCEELSLVQSGRLLLDVREKVESQQAGDPLRFYDPAYLEIFLLDWLTRRSIKLGDINAAGSDVQLLVGHLKSNGLQAQANLLKDTIISNAPEPDAAGTAAMAVKQEIESDNQQSYCSTQIDALKLTRENAGIALIINQQKFHRNKFLSPDPLRRRDGTDVDKERLIEVFSSMGYNVEAYDNVDHMGIIERIRSACDRSLVRDSLVVFILSHGFEEAVYASNSIAMKITDIEDLLCSYDTLYYKPKLLIIQACQEKLVHKKKPNELFRIDVTTVSPDQHIDMLRAMSTVNGYAALRHTQTGSWFIGSLCDAIDRRSASEHIADILTIVTNEVSKKRGSNDESMVPNVNSTFRQHVYFPPRL
nr:DREDD isoform gamma [Drosophila melanogaster]